MSSKPSLENIAQSSSLDHIFQHILDISRGDSNITDDMIAKAESDALQNILSGLQMLHEDLDLYKAELKSTMEAEYQVNVLKEKNKELEQFNYAASHDLQEPLRTILNFSTLLKKNHVSQLDEEALRYINYMNDAAQRMSSLILDLSHYSRIGKFQDLTSVDLNKVIEQVSTDLTAIITKEKVEFKVSILPIIHANEATIRQVFQHLITNAIKFRQPNVPCKIEINCITSKEGHTIEIKDNGIGISSKYQEKIFTIFQRLHSKEKYKGTGIGLALCKKIIEMHHGKIWVKSTQGQGSSFFLFLPK